MSVVHYVTSPAFFLYIIVFLSCSSTPQCSPNSGSGSPVAKWPPIRYAPWYNNSTPCIALIFVCSRAMEGLCLSFSLTAVHTYLPFYFEAWLMGRQPWHSCRRCGACYYAYINILINTWSAIEEIITCHHSTVWEEYALLCVYALTHVHLRVSSRKYDLCSSCSSPSINEFDSRPSDLESSLRAATHTYIQ